VSVDRGGFSPFLKGDQMKKFKVIAAYYTYCTAEIEAETEDEAYETARGMDGGSFTPSGEYFDWHINEVEEIE
jgi:hypothetical protein